ncbi:MAG: molybdenum cofactor biosynthesis F family protein [Oscillospiraceae bacterium]|nr:molybdenum cofactor biosynthesis F family protein [Oscillospiraceae bacterium]
MFRLDYKQLNKKEVEDVLAKASPPAGAAALCGKFAGKSLKIVLDKLPVEGPVLEYEFLSDTKLNLKENGAAAVSCDYAALSMKDWSLLTHMVPGTKKGYAIIVNWDTSAVTAYEMWFIDYEGDVPDTKKGLVQMGQAGGMKPFVNREVQRQCYFGYIERDGKAPPEQRPKITLQLENAMIKWKEDRGKKWLTTYVSSLFTTFVELDTPDGGDVLTFVSDLFEVDEHTYIHCYGEVEFSGRLSVEVFDLFSMKKIGMTMGIDENSAFEYTVYKGHGKYLGRYATFFDFNDRGDKLSDFISSRFDFSVKGARYSYRPSIMTKQITQEDVDRIAKDPLIFSQERTAERIMISSWVPEDTAYCVGKTVAFRSDDGLTVEMRFNSVTELEYKVDGEGVWHAEQYRAAELDEDLIVFAFYRSGSNPPSHMVFALDFKNGLGTCIRSKLGNKYDLHDVEPHYHFGMFEAEGVVPTRIFRHGFTDELLGRAFTQYWSDTMSSLHIYNAPHSYSWTIIANDKPGSPGNRAGSAVWSSPCEYIKLRDDIYCMSWVEHKWEGIIDSLFRNLRTGYDCAFGYGVSHDGDFLHLDKTGCRTRFAGYVDLSGIYPLRNYNPLA